MAVAETALRKWERVRGFAPALSRRVREFAPALQRGGFALALSCHRAQATRGRVGRRVKAAPPIIG